MEKQTLTSHQKKELSEIIRNSEAKAPEVRRAQAILLIDSNAPATTITTLTNYTRRHAWRLKRQYVTNGRDAIADKREGEPKPLLTKKQRQAVIATLTTKTPDEAGYYGEGWTTNMLGDFIERRYHVRYKSRTSYYLLFKDARFTFHKPDKQYEKHDEEEVQTWRHKAARRLRQIWDQPNVTVLTGDEMVLSTQTTTQKVWLPAGEYPKIEVAQKRENRSVYGFLDVKTGREHAWKSSWQNMYETVKVLKKLRKRYPNQQLLLLWDSARWHVGSKVTEWMKADGRVETLPFPRYSPEENPQEHVWKSSRSAVTHNRFIDDIDEATDDFVRYLNRTPFPYRLLGLSDIS